jgi:hypothetical protein
VVAGGARGRVEGCQGCDVAFRAWWGVMATRGVARAVASRILARGGGLGWGGGAS